MKKAIQNNLNYEFIEKLKNLPFIDEIWLFGSRARGDHKDKSDIDIAVICPKSTEDDWIIVTDIIENSDTLLKIDCIKFDKDKISTDLFNNILKEKKVLYAKKQN